MNIALRPICLGRTVIRLFRAAGAGRRRDCRRARPQGRSQEPEIAGAEMELGRSPEARTQGLEAPHRGRIAPVRALPARGIGPPWNPQIAGRLAPATVLLEDVMDNDKSLMERITETVKDIANIAATAADQALKAEA